MKNYILEDMAILNMKRVHKQEFNSQSPYIYEIEKEMTIEEKIEFIDKHRDGVASYMLDLFEKWENEKDSLSKDKYGHIRTVSKKAWIKRNDPRKILSEFDLGTYYLFRQRFSSFGTVCPVERHGRDMVYTGSHIVEQWFHNLLDELFYQEKKHFEDTDPYMIKIKKIKELGSFYGSIFNVKELNDIVWNGTVLVSEKNVDAYLKAYEALGESMKEIEEQLLIDLEEAE